MAGRDEHVAAVEAARVAIDEWWGMIAVAVAKGEAVTALVSEVTGQGTHFHAGQITAPYHCDRAVRSLRGASLMVQEAGDKLGLYREAL